jgi:hypothetical protein
VCIFLSLDGKESEEEVGNVGNGKESMYSKYKTEDGTNS